ncbi:hypothetical protein QE417_004504 [Mucilaginibacter terrae]|uniref:Uncharacterized protein n=1 Tax=Mucilaginibacter terrae TaxID=1955052 RepID=A0ABU3H091_9SPHI|nr:hypothetical protein [Mucilaginibacter terrae]
MKKLLTKSTYRFDNQDVQKMNILYRINCKLNFVSLLMLKTL